MSNLDQIHSLLRKLNGEENIFRALQLAREISWMLQSPGVEAIEAESGRVYIPSTTPSALLATQRHI